MSLHRLAPLIAFALLLAWIFAGPVFGSGMFCFRDVAHYYYPLFEFTTDLWAKGQVPLWNPYENLGVPLAADATASVFYPGKVIFALPIDYSRLYKLYIVGHVLLAAATAYTLTRRWKVSRDGSALAAICYAFSGNVLYQYCNVVFLVGAAWLPLAVLAADRALVERSIRWAVALGVVLAMITLGGDPQMAYHCGVLTVIYSAIRWQRSRGSSPAKPNTNPKRKRGTRATSPQPAPSLALRVSESWRRIDSRRLLRSRLVLLLIAATCGLALSAVQVLPSLEFNRVGHRTRSSVARSVWEVPPRLLCDRSLPPDASWYDGLLCRKIQRGSHQEHAYHFSVGPWRLAEYVWPNFAGRQFPVHRRWLEVIPAEGRVWVPSFYMGIVPLVLAVGSLRFRRSDPRTKWMSWAVVLGVTAALGWHGVGWLIDEIRTAAGADPSSPWLIGEPVGGVYWLLTVLLPGYVNFRYPAKWLVVAGLGLSVLAGGGWDRIHSGESRRTRRAMLGVAAVSLLGALLSLAIRPFWHQWLTGVEPDVLFGPLDTVGAANDLLRAFSQTAMVAGLCWWLLGWAQNGNRLARPAMLILVAIDLAAANGWMVATAPADAWSNTPRLAQTIDSARPDLSDGGPYRVYRRSIWMPPSYRVSSSGNRMAEAVRWDRDSLWPKYSLTSRIPVAEVHGSMMPFDHQTLLREMRRRGVESVPLHADLAWLNAKYLILRKRDCDSSLSPASLPDGSLGPVDQLPEDVCFAINTGAYPRVWIVHHVELMPPIDPHDPAEVRRRTRDVFWPGGKSRDLRSTAVVEETAKRAPFSPATLGQADQAEPTATDRDDIEPEYCRIVRHEPLQVEIEARLNRPGLVVLCDQFYRGWRLEVETGGGEAKTVPILRTNRVMRGVWLPAGEHRLVWTYRPNSFRLGAIVSSMAWLALTAGFITILRRPKPADVRRQRPLVS